MIDLRKAMELTTEVAAILLRGPRSLKDWAMLGEYVDCVDAGVLDAPKSLTVKAKGYIKENLCECIMDYAGSAEMHSVINRSWALSDKRELNLRKLEMQQKALSHIVSKIRMSV